MVQASVVDAVLRGAVERGDIFGVVATASDRKGTVYTGAAGTRSADRPAPMTADSVFRVASMTKVVTSAAAAQLYERGELDLDAPVDSIVPSWAELKVLVGFEGDT